MSAENSYAIEGPGSVAAGLADAIRSVRKIRPLLREWRRRRRFRADLRRLLEIGPHMIDDIGLAYEDALRESEEPVWRP